MGGCLDAQMDGWMDARADIWKKESKQECLGWILSMSFKIRRSYVVFYNCCSSNLSVMIKEDTVKV